ncbi:MAG: HAD family hydrolase [Myxococcales bacterium]|nr:HAD family hydrolase [Myxococcales bacterium]
MTEPSFAGLALPRLQELLARIERTRLGVLGDFCLDVYWFLDPSAAELSLETGLPTQPVAEQRCELGGAGNVVNNLRAIGCRRIEAFGVGGADPWGRELRRLLAEAGTVTDGLLEEARQWATPAYIKPHRNDEETNRLDFGNFNRLPDETAARLIAALAARLDELDLVVVNEQVAQGIHTERLRRELAALMRARPDKRFIVDSRHHSEAYPDAWLKINDREAAHLIGAAYPEGARIRLEDTKRAAGELFARHRRPVFVTRGPRGLVVGDETGLGEIPGIQIFGKVDPVGAGDSLLAGVAAATAAGATVLEAATFGNLVASVTVQKWRQTGTATPAEILAAGADPDYVYRPELAEDIRRVRYLPGTEFEVVGDRRPPARVTHVIFDHDGTISTLREGWERIMEPMMIRAILGPRYESADDSLYHRVVDRVRDFIDKSTGIQTLAQMQGLARMVREFGCVPEADVLDEHGYKKIYNDALLAVVRRRIAKFDAAELSLADYTVKNAVRLLEALRRAGVRLYLASGTDEQDVVAEAEALGYAGLFAGAIYGAVGDVRHEAKRLVIERILGEIGDPAGLVAIGDGPVEIRETHKRGGYAIGVATDELRRFGLNEAKRARLVRAGADLIIPDYSQLPALLRFLNVAE